MGTHPISRRTTRTTIIILSPTKPRTTQPSSIQATRARCSQATKVLHIEATSGAIIMDQTAERAPQPRRMPIRQRRVGEGAAPNFLICRGPQALARVVDVRLLKHPVNRPHKRLRQHRVKRQLPRSMRMTTPSVRQRTYV